jgi:hypothetical protein
VDGFSHFLSRALVIGLKDVDEFRDDNVHQYQ